MIYAIIIIALLFIRGAFRAGEIAIDEVSDTKIKSLIEKDKKYLKVLNVKSKVQKLPVTLSIGRAIAGAAIAVLAVIIANTFSMAYHTRVIVTIVTILVVAFVLAAVTDLVPRKIAEKDIEKTALKAATPVNILMILLTPFSYTAFAVAWLLGLLCGVRVTFKREIVTEEEILEMVDEGNEKGVIEESQREMINNIFEFDDSSVSDVMTHRTDICAIDIKSQIRDVVYLAINEGYSRIPVYEGTVDKIIGLMYVKDLLCLVGCEHSEDFTVQQFMRQVMFVPETGKCKDVFEEMTKKKAQMAVVVDEYGGTAGIVTMEDLLEEIVGNIQDEYDDESDEVSQIDTGVFTIDGDADPEDIAEELGFKLPEGHHYDTMSAFVVDLLGRIPDENENVSVRYSNVEFTVLLVEDNWISKIKAVCDKN